MSKVASSQPIDDSLKNFSPTDPKYKVSDEFLPDKECLWPYAADQCGWVMVHNALRGEIIQFQETLAAIKARRGTLKAWEVECIQDVFIAHLYNMEEHHSTEDNILSPEFMKRFHYPDKLTDDHEAIFAQLDKASDIVKSLKAGDDTITTIDSLSREFDLYKECIFPHFREEETYGLPLSRAYFSPKEFQKVMSKGHEKNPPNPEAIGCFIHFNGVKSIRHFLKAEGIPYFLWYLEVRRSYNKYVTETLVKVNALKAGVEPMYPKTSCFSCMSLSAVAEPMPFSQPSVAAHDKSLNTQDGCSTNETVLSDEAA